jgi:hypothetical protein
MDIVHDFFNQNGGGENLIKSISKLTKSNIYTAFSIKKEENIIQPKINLLLKLNTLFVFIYYNFFFKLNTKNIILFSGNHCCFSINRCIGKKKFLYAHSLPKILFSELYLDLDKRKILGYLKKKLINNYYFNITKLDKIYFNSIKTKKKFLYVFPELDKKVKLDVMYPFSDLQFVSSKRLNIKEAFLKNKYFVINSRHQSSKNIFHLLLLLKPFLIENKDIKVYLTHEGGQTKSYENLYLNDNQLFFTGYLSYDKYKELLINSIAVIFPSRDEDFGISALDAYNLNVPVLIQKNCGFSEILDKNYEFFYDDTDFLDVLKKAINNQNLFSYRNKINLKNSFVEKINLALI